MSTMTEQQINEYLSSPNTCPYCGSTDIEAAGSFYTDGSHVVQPVECLECEKDWTDKYTLTGVT